MKRILRIIGGILVLFVAGICLALRFLMDAALELAD